MAEDTLKVHVQIMESQQLISGPPLLVKHLDSLLDDEELSDIKVLTSTKSLPASKIILAGNYN